MEGVGLDGAYAATAVGGEIIGKVACVTTAAVYGGRGYSILCQGIAEGQGYGIENVKKSAYSLAP